MRNIHLLIFFLAIALISCTGSKKHFEWVKVNSSAYLQNQPTPTTSQNLEPKEIQITVYLKERSAVNYEKSDEFFNHIPVAPADRNFDKKSLITYKRLKTNPNNSDYIYRDEDIEESKLNSGLKRLENTISKNRTLNNQRELPDKGQSRFNISKEQLLLSAVASLLILSLLVWLFFRNRTKKAEKH